MTHVSVFRCSLVYSIHTHTYNAISISAGAGQAALIHSPFSFIGHTDDRVRTTFTGLPPHISSFLAHCVRKRYWSVYTLHLIFHSSAFNGNNNNNNNNSSTWLFSFLEFEIVPFYFVRVSCAVRWTHCWKLPSPKIAKHRIDPFESNRKYIWTEYADKPFHLWQNNNAKT